MLESFDTLLAFDAARSVCLVDVDTEPVAAPFPAPAAPPLCFSKYFNTLWSCFVSGLYFRNSFTRILSWSLRKLVSTSFSFVKFSKSTTFRSSSFILRSLRSLNAFCAALFCATRFIRVSGSSSWYRFFLEALLFCAPPLSTSAIFYFLVLVSVLVLGVSKKPSSCRLFWYLVLRAVSKSKRLSSSFCILGFSYIMVKSAHHPPTHSFTCIERGKSPSQFPPVLHRCGIAQRNYRTRNWRAPLSVTGKDTVLA